MSIHRSRGLAALAALLTVLASSLAFGVGPASAGRDDPPGDPDANHCFNAFGVDLNELYGVSDQFRNRECQVVSAGEHWIFGPIVWIVDDGVDSLYPDGYVPASPNPIEDFAAKLVSVKVVVDGKAHVFSPSEALRTDIRVAQLEPGAWDESWPMASMLPRLSPLSVGEHTIQPFIVLSAEHCDGIGAVEEENCIPAGEIPFGPPRPLTVTSPAQGRPPAVSWQPTSTPARSAPVRTS
jgi:hypothetical protein